MNKIKTIQHPDYKDQCLYRLSDLTQRCLEMCYWLDESGSIYSTAVSHDRPKRLEKRFNTKTGERDTYRLYSSGNTYDNDEIIDLLKKMKSMNHASIQEKERRKAMVEVAPGLSVNKQIKYAICTEKGSILPNIFSSTDEALHNVKQNSLQNVVICEILLLPVIQVYETKTEIKNVEY